MAVRQGVDGNDRKKAIDLSSGDSNSVRHVLDLDGSIYRQPWSYFDEFTVLILIIRGTVLNTW